MDSEERNFHHPYEPYDIQRQFMNAVYDCLEDGKVGIFESPTGTGKSLSLICGALTWLRDHKRRTFQEGIGISAVDSDDPPWMVEFARNQRKQKALRRRQELEARLTSIREKEKRVKARYENSEPNPKRQKVNTNRGTIEDENEARFILDDYDSNDENFISKEHDYDNFGLSAETQALIDKLGFSLRPKPVQDKEEAVDELKVFFCSRTHSQLTQISSELQKVKFPPAIMPDNSTEEAMNDASTLTEDVKHLTLGSRKNLCINPKVNRLNSATAINEKCLEIQQPGTSSDCKCSFLPTKENEALVNEFRDHALARVRDIEDLGLLGKKIGICPYYASRPTAKYCEMVTLPYPLLLQKSAREALDLSLKDHIIIIDEAHNLMEAILGIHSISVSLMQLQEARAQLLVYLQKFRNKLKGKNRVYIAQTVRLVDSLAGYLQAKNAEPQSSDGIVNMGDLLTGKGVDQINLFKLNRYLQESKLARKVDGYTSFAQKAKSEEGRLESSAKNSLTVRQTVPVLMQIQGFFLSLMNPSAEGRFFFSKDDTSGICLRYMLLDPTFHFKDIVDEARAVILAGGTMSPMSDYEQYLLSYLDSSRITTLSCGHVIPSSHLLAIPVVHAPSGADFDFTFEKRNSEEMMINLATAVSSFARHIPDGVVVFFPSYSYLDTCIAAWKRLRSAPSPGSRSLWDHLLTTKHIFVEQRNLQESSDTPSTSKQTSTIDSVLSSYSSSVNSGDGQGALLFAVIGGSLSEGINFSDALGRGVIVVGLPYPNPHSAEWKAKMQYISAKTAGTGGDGKGAAREFYENACMRAVNQCIGRAIRHRQDYASILMLDRRYGGQRIQAKLPGWIRGGLTKATGIRDVEKRLDEFFAGKS